MTHVFLLSGELASRFALTRVQGGNILSNISRVILGRQVCLRTGGEAGGT